MIKTSKIHFLFFQGNSNQNMGVGVTNCRSDDAISINPINIPINSGWMCKKRQIYSTWKWRYFELFQSGKLLYFTDESKHTRKGIVKLSTIIGFNVVDRKTFEVITPDRVWCFQCKFKSERDHWIESMKSIKNSQIHHDADIPNERDYFNLSTNHSVLKLIAKMGPPEGEKILYSDRILITNDTKKPKQHQQQETTVLMLTTVAMYHLHPMEGDDSTKCHQRIPLNAITSCTVLNREELSIDGVVYQTETKNMWVILRILYKFKVSLLFQSKEDESSFHRDLAMMLIHDDHDGGGEEEEEEEEVVDLLPMKSIKSFSCMLTPKSTVVTDHEMKEIHDTDHEQTECGPLPHIIKYPSPSYNDNHRNHRRDHEMHHDGDDYGDISRSNTTVVESNDSSRSRSLDLAAARTDGYGLSTTETERSNTTIPTHRNDNSSVSTLSALLRNREQTEMDNEQKARCKISKKSLKARNFTILSVIGRGSFGKILMVKKKGEDTVFAMKILKKTHIIENQQVRNIKAERRVLKNIDHPFLMKLRYAFQSERKLYFVLDYYRGGDLNHNLQRRQRFTSVEAKFIAAQIALAIGCLHSHGIVYRDLKPENILMDDVGNCCLTDFGLCKDLSDCASGSTETFCGTPEYLAPEVIKEKPYDRNVDWWGLGILIFELTVGVVPFFSDSNSNMFQKIISAKLGFPSWVEGGCEHLIRGLLQRKVCKRLGFKNDIDDIRTHPWFGDLDWNAIFNKEIDPPYKPDVDLRDGMESVPQNVSRRYLREEATDTYADKPSVEGMFDGWTYSNDARGDNQKIPRKMLADSSLSSLDTGNSMGLKARNLNSNLQSCTKSGKSKKGTLFLMNSMSPTSMMTQLAEVEDEEADHE